MFIFVVFIIGVAKLELHYAIPVQEIDEHVENQRTTHKEAHTHRIRSISCVPKRAGPQIFCKQTRFLNFL